VRSGIANERGNLAFHIFLWAVFDQIQLRLQTDDDQAGGASSGPEASIRVTLQPGEVREIVEVKEVTAALEAETSSLGQVIENKKILELPLNGRNAFALGLLPGNTTPMFGMGSNLPFIAGGGRFSANEVTLDGVETIRVQRRLDRAQRHAVTLGGRGAGVQSQDEHLLGGIRSRGGSGDQCHH
jgi:hypothetical protein